MHLVYEDTKEEILAIERRAKHQPPHLHQTVELVYVMKGSLELGVGLELFHMEEGDIGLVFPDVIHHCQVFSEQYSEVLYINIPTRTLGTYEELLKRKAPLLHRWHHPSVQARHSRSVGLGIQVVLRLQPCSSHRVSLATSSL